ncbi:MAG: 16S rRNA (guanine(527)-N(7))-methyltransferase RsmG [Bacteroidales bacterium]|nr:16S rRNA (guanine(527)-N(7))-methyltransferase RsmG [Bacteroidales bacterium]
MDKLLQFFPNLNSYQIEQFKQLDPLYKEWNAKINVISRKDIDHLYEHHILHSLTIAAFFDFSNHTILDVGTGGGFPGIPLAIMFPHCQFTLVDSIGKKIKVVEQISNSLKLTNVKTLHINVKEHKQTYDYIVSRAVCNFNEFVAITRKNLSYNPYGGIIYLKGGDLLQELTLFKDKIQIFNIYDKIPIPFFETKKIVWLKTNLLNH